MRQFFDANQGDEKVSALLRQLPWTHHLIILGQAKEPEHRIFYMMRSVSSVGSLGLNTSVRYSLKRLA